MKDQVWNGLTLSKECVFCKYHPSNTAKTGGTQPTDVQQLKAEIAYIIKDYITDDNRISLTKISVMLHKLRQLSAV